MTSAPAIRLVKRLWFQQIVLFILCLGILLKTLAPTLYTLDSAEFSIGAVKLSIVHAPGYSLYLIAAHIFSWLPVGDLSYRVNLFSAVNLALTAPVLYTLLAHLTESRWAAVCAALGFMWSYYVWGTGIVAEIYATQLFMLSLVLGMVAFLYRSPASIRLRMVIGTGVVFGIVVAMHPVSILFAPGLVVTFRMLKIRWRDSFIAAGAAGTVFVVSLIYFPLCYAARPLLNLAGHYDAQGHFEPVDLRTVSGIWWIISGRQFSNMFFIHGLLPNVRQFFSLFWANYLGVGVLIGSLGLYEVYRTERRLFWIWLVFTLPYTYFYACYGVSDVNTMLGPVYLMWAIMIAFGVRGLKLPPRVRPTAALGLPLILLVINFPLLNLSTDRSVRTRAEHLVKAIPPHATVMGVWWDIVPVQYLHIIEKQRPDLTLYNLFLFSKSDYHAYIVWHLENSPDPLVILGNAPPDLPDHLQASMSLLTLDVSSTGKITSDPVIAGVILIRSTNTP